MTNPTKYYTLRDSGSPTTTVNLYNVIRQTAGSVNVFNNTKHILDDGSLAIDYGTDKRVWQFVIETPPDRTTSFTTSNLTDIETLYALRLTQTIQLVDNWKEAAEVIDVHFSQLQKEPNPTTGRYRYILRLEEA